MKISNIYRTYFGQTFNGQLSPERRAGDLGPRCAELIARAYGAVHIEATYDTGSANSLRGLQYVKSQLALATFRDGAWRIECAGEHAAYAAWDSHFEMISAGVFRAITLFPGHWSRTTWPTWKLDLDADVDIDTTAFEAAIKADDDMARDAVVWRPRPNQFVIRFVNHEGTCLCPDGTKWSFVVTNEIKRIIARSIGVDVDALPSALANDPVVGRSLYCRKGRYYDRYTGYPSPEIVERVVGFGTTKRIRRAHMAA
jgi:hypothetical protein